MTLNQDSLPEFIGQIVDIFEDFCAENEITWPNEDRDEYIKDGGCEEDEAAVIFGEDYDYIADPVQSGVETYGLTESNRLDTEKETDFIVSIIDEFYNLLADRNVESMKSDKLRDEIGLALKIDRILQHWHKTEEG